MGHVTMENRHGLAVAGMVTQANGTAERRASEIMLKAKSKAAGRRITAGEDKAYDTADHVANLRARNVTPHVTQNDSPTKTGRRRKSAIDTRTTRHEGYGMSQTRRAMIECIFGWGKQHGTMLELGIHCVTARMIHSSTLFSEMFVAGIRSANHATTALGWAANRTVGHTWMVQARTTDGRVIYRGVHRRNVYLGAGGGSLAASLMVNLRFFHDDARTCTVFRGARVKVHANGQCAT
jgi:hypothetical protein